MTTKVLNLYAGIGGNRKHWENVNVTAIEHNESIASYYQDQFPDDTVLVTDAHDYLETHLRDDWDFIWSSPPCTTHSRINIMKVFDNTKERGNHTYTPQYSDMRLYQEILLLQSFAPKTTNWVVENVTSYYTPLIKPQRLGRHYFWANYNIPTQNIDNTTVTIETDSIREFEREYGFDVSEIDIRGDKLLRNCTHPELGKHVFESRHTQTQLIEY